MVSQYNNEKLAKYSYLCKRAVFQVGCFLFLSFFLSFSSDLIDYGSWIHIDPIFVILKPIKLFIISIL